MKKAILSLGVFMLLLALAVGPVFADEAINKDTGLNSNNYAITAEVDFDVVYNDNEAKLCNFTFVGANTGFNRISGDGDDNSLGTGSAGAVANISNFQNTNVSVIEGEDGDSELVAKNIDTGEGSENWAVAADVDAAIVWNKNNARLCNFTFAIANSGFNRIGGNPCDQCGGDGDKNSIRTGAASAEANTINVQNTNLSMISVGGSDGSISAMNKETGKKSDNYAIAANVDAAAVVNLNDARAMNSTVALANSGFNGISGDDENSITAGTALANANTTNLQNTNVAVVEQGGSDGSIDASNKDTSGCSENVAVGADVEVAVVVNDNDAKLGNATVAGANSGGNVVSGDDNNSISTGAASATADTTNVQNTNVTVIGGGSCLFPDLCEPQCGATCN
ncbi:MAG: hypothetical protein MUP45_02300 [Candidatus Marinimicrobia bacterium]|nr:hypothetical protein [Candidatus Neomarinimicrobiota bacterium]